MTEGFNSPTPDDLRAIHKSVPDLLKERQKKFLDGAAAKAGIKPGDVVCGICGEVIKIHSKNPDKKYCGVCQGRLNAGETALITLDFRYMFVSPDKLLQAQMVAQGSVSVDDRKIPTEVIKAMAGKVIGVLPRLMDILEIKSKASQDGQAPQN